MTDEQSAPAGKGFTERVHQILVRRWVAWALAIVSLTGLAGAIMLWALGSPASADLSPDDLRTLAMVTGAAACFSSRTVPMLLGAASGLTAACLTVAAIVAAIIGTVGAT